MVCDNLDAIVFPRNYNASVPFNDRLAHAQKRLSTYHDLFATAVPFFIQMQERANQT
jgi:hypothetical protein